MVLSQRNPHVIVDLALRRAHVFPEKLFNLRIGESVLELRFGGVMRVHPSQMNQMTNPNTRVLRSIVIVKDATISFHTWSFQKIKQTSAGAHTTRYGEGPQRANGIIARFDETALRKTAALLEIPYRAKGFAADPPSTEMKRVLRRSATICMLSCPCTVLTSSSRLTAPFRASPTESSMPLFKMSLQYRRSFLKMREAGTIALFASG